MSFKCTNAKDSSDKIMEVLTGSGRCNAELIHCYDSRMVELALEKINAYSYDVIFIVWEWEFDIDMIETFVGSVHAKFPKLRLVAASNRPGCCEILREAGCVDEFETATNRELYEGRVLEQIEE